MTYVLVTTSHRGVFAGELADDSAPASVTLRNARNCIYWTSDVGGFAGLASAGPTTQCRIGAPVGTITLYDVTSVAECDDEAITAWRQANVYRG